MVGRVITRDHTLSRIAADQHGAFTIDQAMSCGFARRTIERRAQRGQYTWLEHKVLAGAASSPTWEQSVVASVLSVGGVAAASHATSAYLWGLTTRRPDRIDVVTTRWDRVRRSAMVHESLDLEVGDLTTLDGVTVTNPARTVVDLGATERWNVPSALDTGLRKELFSLDEVERFVARVGKRGRRGVGVIRPLIKERRAWVGITESALEDRFRRIIARSSLPLPVSQFVVEDDAGRFVCRSDFAYPSHKVLVELDGVAYHTDPETFQRDRTKQNRALLLGWRTLRFTWSDLTSDPDGVASVLADMCGK
jgi:hypothetical protein